MDTITAQQKNLAAVAHLGYLFVAMAAVLCFLSGWMLIPSLLALAALAYVEFHASPNSSFLREHQRQARRHHALGLIGAFLLVAFAVWAVPFTWGIGTAMTAIAAPILGVLWMVPTVSAVHCAYLGEPYEYKLERRLVRSQKTDPIPA